jgi:hypothetical protein
MLQVLDYFSHFFAGHRLNTTIKVSVTKELHLSIDLFVMISDCIIGLIRSELALEAFDQGGGMAFRIIYNCILSLDV